MLVCCLDALRSERISSVSVSACKIASLSQRARATQRRIISQRAHRISKSRDVARRNNDARVPHLVSQPGALIGHYNYGVAGREDPPKFGRQNQIGGLRLLRNEMDVSRFEQFGKTLSHLQPQELHIAQVRRQALQRLLVGAITTKDETDVRFELIQ
jgi:hypothetical protein